MGQRQRRNHAGDSPRGRVRGPWGRLLLEVNGEYGGGCLGASHGATTAASSPNPASLGDANCDDRIDSRDATMIMQLFAGLSRFLPCQHAADVNGNGGVGPLDALLILQYNAGMLESLPP